MKPWAVLRDRSGWHRAVDRLTYWDRASEQEVGEADSYLEACKIADQYNQISEVQDG
jgi:hypothetical protein